MCPISGSNWNDSSDAGVWYLNLNNVRSNSNNNVGFRADSVSPHGLNSRSGTKGDAFRRVVQITAKSVGFHDSGRCHVALEGFVP